MSGWLNKTTQKIINNGEEKDLISNVVGGIGDGLKLGASLLKDTIGKAVPLSKLEK